jgi:hypothetical protein
MLAILAAIIVIAASVGWVAFKLLWTNIKRDRDRGWGES